MVAIGALLQQCAPQVSTVLMEALVRAESDWRPLAIGMDETATRIKQPTNLSDAVAVAKALDAAGHTFFVGLAQIHVSNVRLYGLTWEQAFDPCQNLATGQQIFWGFFHRASTSGYSGAAAIWAALRGYNSGGVHRAVSDGYAKRIFTYMSRSPIRVQRGRLTVPANAQQAGGATVSSLKAGDMDPTAKRRDESLDIFERRKTEVGFSRSVLSPMQLSGSHT